MNRCKLILFFAVLFMCLNTSAQQYKNSEENVVGRIYDGKTTALGFSGGETSLEIRVHYDSIDDFTRFTDKKAAKKFISVFLKGGITNAKKFVDLAKFDFRRSNGLLIGASARISFNDIYVLDHQRPFQYDTFILSVQYSYDKFDLFDPRSQTIANRSPSKLEINGGWNHYFFLFGGENFSRGTTLVMSLNAAFNPLTYNSSALSNFSKIDDKVFAENAIIVANEFDGKYGVLDTGIETAELALSIPILFDYTPLKKLPYVIPVPYVSSEFFSYNKPKWNAGMLFVFSSNVIMDVLKSDPDPKIDGKRKLNNPSSLSIGIDWTIQGESRSKPNVFLTGNISFD